MSSTHLKSKNLGNRQKPFTIQRMAVTKKTVPPRWRKEVERILITDEQLARRIKILAREIEVVTAKKVAFVLFKNEIPMTEYKIAKYFNRSAPIVNRGVHSITSLIPLTKSEHAIVDGFTNILKQVTEWKKQVNYKNIVFSVETKNVKI